MACNLGINKIGVKMKQLIVFTALCGIVLNIISFELFGTPVENKIEAARTINTMHVFENKLFIGHGDYGVNTGPTDIIYYDFNDKTWNSKFTIDDEAIMRYVEIDSNLIIPGVDATDNWDFGNYYIYDGVKWKKNRSIPHGIHVFDIIKYDSILYCATGNYLAIDSLNELAPGAILSSINGSQWNYDYISPSDKNLVYRITDFIEYDNKLMAFYYGYTGLTKNEIPEEYHSFLGKPFVQDTIEYYLVLMSDIMGQSDVLVYENDFWRLSNIIPDEKIVTLKPFLFNEKLLLYAVKGDYVTGIGNYVRNNGVLPDNANTELYMYDSEKTVKIKMDFDLIVDICKYNTSLFMLILRNKEYLLLKSDDLKKWNAMPIPQYAGDIMSFTINGNDVFFGNSRGEIYKSDSRF